MVALVGVGAGGGLALIGVQPFDEHAEERTERLARELGVPVLREDVAGAGVKLLVGASGLALAFVDKTRGKPFLIDFLALSWRSRFQQPLAKNHIFRRALGVRDEPLTVVDATAGFGQDAMLAVTLDCRVTALERSPVIATLLRDAVDRAREDDVLRIKMKQIRIECTDAVTWLGALSERPDVVYLDPMFDKPKKSAKSPKEMQLLQELLDPVAPGEEEALLAAALAATKGRVVVKRPLKARALQTAPSHSFKGQSIRYDVYVRG